jgi:hypothetical protein
MIGRNNMLGYFGEAATGQQLLPFGPNQIITQRYVYNAAGKGSRTDILINRPSAALRAIFPDAADPWRLGVIDVKTTDSAKLPYDLLTRNQQAVLVPLSASGGKMSGPLADMLRTVPQLAPGEASQLLVFRVGPGDFLRMPISLRRLLKTNTFEEILKGTAGARNAERMASFLKTVTILVEPVK